MNYINYYYRFSRNVISRLFGPFISIIIKYKTKIVFKNKDSVVIVFSIGKVGSSSVYNSLVKSKSINFPIFHLHCLNENRLKLQKTRYLNSKRKSIPLHLIRSNAIINELKSFNGNIYLISLIREPIGREMSSLFQDSFNFSHNINLDKKNFKKIVDLKILKLTESLPENEWFDKEINENFGIDIFNIPFNPSKGYYISKSKNLHFGLIRMEDLQTKFISFSNSLFEKNLDIKLSQDNKAEDKFYNLDYNKFKSFLKINSLNLNKIIKSRYIKIFYPDKIDLIKRKYGE